MINTIREGGDGKVFENDLAIVESLPSLYPLKEFEADAVQRVVSRKGDGWIPVSERLPEVETGGLGWRRVDGKKKIYRHETPREEYR